MAIDVKTCSVYWYAFPDLNPNSYNNLFNIKLDLNVFIKVKFSVND